MSVTLKVNSTGNTFTIASGDRPGNHNTTGGAFLKNLGKPSLIGDMVSQLNNTGVLNPTGTTVALANTNTKTIPLSTSTQPYTLYRTTSDGTISGAVLNFPTTGLVDGSTVSFVTTGIVTTVTGTLSSAPIPVLAATVAGKKYTFVYNLAATTWFQV